MKTGLWFAVFLYAFLFLNLSRSQNSTAGTKEVFCPDGYAFKVDASHYIACENFDEFHQSQQKGRQRPDLFIK